jgi:hypothetical protein
MKALERFGVGVAVLTGVYLLLPVVVFDFTSVKHGAKPSGKDE